MSRDSGTSRMPSIRPFSHHHGRSSVDSRPTSIPKNCARSFDVTASHSPKTISQTVSQRVPVSCRTIPCSRSISSAVATSPAALRRSA
jgi:hypothetical protein